MPEHEIFTFDKGINLKKSPLLLAQNEVYSVEGFNYGHNGIMECRAPKTLLTTPDHPYSWADLTNIRNIHRYNDYVIAIAKEYCPGGSDGAYFNYVFHRAYGATPFNNLVANPTFDSDTEWTKGDGWAILTGIAHCNGTQLANSGLSQAISITLAKIYRTSYTVSEYAGGNVVMMLGTGAAGSIGDWKAANGTYHETLTHGAGAAKLYVVGDDDFIGSIDNVKCHLVGKDEGIMLGNEKPSMVDYKKFTFITDEEDSKMFDSGHCYPWRIENPGAPTVSEGANGQSGMTAGTYNCYVTFYIKFPNGEVYETGPSPAASVTVSSKNIDWDMIPICDQNGLTGSELTIHRKLYRSIAGVSYLAYTIEDNTTTTQLDIIYDTLLQANALLTTTGYNIPPLGGSGLALHLQRIFFVKGRYLYYSEAYIPQAFKTTSYLTVTKLDEDLIAVITWADQLYMASKETWYRLNGVDSSTWAIKKTFTHTAIINRDTLEATGFGLIGLWYDGIYMFDGLTSRNITEKILGKAFFTDLDDLDVCYSELEGSKYHFYYASSGSTLDKHLILDLADYPEIIAYHDDFIPTAHEFNVGAGINYLAKLGSEYEESGTETIATSLRTGDRGFGNIAQRKNIEYLYYDINTGGVDVTVTIYVDGTSVHTITLNSSTRVRKRSGKFPVTAEGYMVSMGITCTDSSGLYIYSPWILEATFVGK